MKKLSICFLGLFLFSVKAFAFDYFDSDIDYWKQKQKEKVNKTKAKPTFNWKKQLDQKNDSFFKEGSHTPPAAIMELMRDPSDKNIKNWFALIEKKNKLASRLHNKIAEYLKKNQSKLKPEEIKITKSNLESLPTLDPNHDRFRFRLYFESSCSHCKRMMGTMQKLQDRGYYVEIMQIDDNKKIRKALPFPVVQATKKELADKKINAWPVLLIGDLKKKVVYRLNGYQSMQSVLNSFSKIKN